MTTKLGIDCLLSDKIDLLKEKRVALLAHVASITSDHRFVPRIFAEHEDINLVKIFTPEHGLYGVAQDMESVDSAVFDSENSIPVISLYGDTVDSLTPKAADLEDIDVLVIDLQDIGTRYYTYIYTMAFCLQACAATHKEVIVCDRPNPLGGTKIEGNLLNIEYRSFVGWYELPVRHGMTMAELAQYFNATEKLSCDVTLIPMQNWQRNQWFDQTGLGFFPPSPNMPTLETAIVYPGMCLFEATEISEGRGTTKPFEWIGTPGLDPLKLSDAMNERELPGVVFLPHVFKPGFQKHAGIDCQGIQLKVTDRDTFEPYLTGLLLLKTIAKLFPNQFAWREKPYEFVQNIPAIDLLTGCQNFRDIIASQKHIRKWIDSWQADCERFAAKRSPYLLYS